MKTFLTILILVPSLSIAKTEKRTPQQVTGNMGTLAEMGTLDLHMPLFVSGNKKRQSVTLNQFLDQALEIDPRGVDANGNFEIEVKILCSGKIKKNSSGNNKYNTVLCAYDTRK